MECNKGKNEKPLGNAPLNAVVSCTKNVSSSRQIATHVPSLPLTTTSASFSDKVHNFLVRWPTDFDPSGDALSTFRLSRLMKKDAFYSDGHGLSSGFQPEEIELSIGLMRGSEMLTLGKAILVITDVENEELMIDLPVSTEKHVVKNKKMDPPALKRTNSKLFGKTSKTTVKMLKPLSFPSDKRRKFHLTENAMIRLNVSINPDDGFSHSTCSDESGLMTNGVSTSVYSSNDTETSSLSYSTKEFASSREYSSREESASYNIHSASKDDAEFHASPRISRSHSHSNPNGNNVRRSHKYHPHVPMDELHNVEEDFSRVRLTPQMSRNSSSHARTHSRSRPQPASGAQGMSDTYNGSQSRNRSNRSSSDGQPMVPMNTNTRSSSRSRPSGRSGRSRSFANEMPPSLTQHSSGTPRAPTPQTTPQKSRSSHEIEYDAGPSTPRSGSRSRIPADRYQVKEMYQQSDGYRQHRENIPRRSHSYYGEDTENENRGNNHQAERNRDKRRSSKPPMGSSHHHENRAAENEQKSNESPMTWLYDKMVGKGDSAEETVKMKNNETKKKMRKSSQLNGPSTADPYYRRPSPKRTMRV